ncbi:MAG: hypothetical protein GXO61_03165 [Epsilonproteobacteria bacterium]|nr:hypothetical protein [Campylobacterota bacterium]
MVGKIVIGTTLGMSLFLNSSCISLHGHIYAKPKPPQHYYHHHKTKVKLSQK